MPAYELTNGDALAAVESLTRHLCADTGYTPTTHPTLDEVRGFGDMCYYKIAGALSSANYPTTQTATAALGWLQNLQVLEMVIALELAYPITGAGEPNERFAEFVRQRDWFYEMLASGGIDGLGFERTHYAAVTGVSVARKNSVRSDPDLVPSRFRRGDFSNPLSVPMLPGTPLSADTLG